ncbi:VOC family protein [Cohnella pontilimi]|uniref:VOC family protein n=1 Tax=Cohnella pontilimi TaxID=2564100 RepID=A0A4U0F5F1_9BACL|nr:VOC family protein [Cohnella pontilimi]TJY39630.1 VOC family protein [Cohnella pontilimi]
MKNRSVPTDGILPHIYYENTDDALTWLREVCGFVEHYRIEFPEGQLHGVMTHHGGSWIMLKNSDRTRTCPAESGVATHSLMVVVEDVDAHYHQAKSLGAKIVQELFDTEYGERLYSVLDPEGHLWEFSQHIRDVHPQSFGAKLAE